MVNTVKYSQFPSGGAIQNGDTIVGLRNGVNTSFDAATVSGGGSTLTVTQVAHGFNAWDVLYLNGSTYTKADSSSDATAEAIGIVVNTPTKDSFVIQQTGHVSNTITPGYGLFTAGSVYFLSGTAGELTLTPTTTAGEVVKPMFVATGATSGWIFPYRGEIISGGSGGGGGGSGAPSNATYITQTPNTTLTNEQALSVLDTGLLKSTTGTGVVSIAVNGMDYYGPGTGTPIPVDEGGTGVATFTPYAVICAGTTNTGPLQNVVSVGTSGQVLTSNGAGSLPTFQASPGTNADWALVETKDLTGVSEVEFKNLDADVCMYKIVVCKAVASGGGVSLRMLVSTDNGATYETSLRYTAALSTNWSWIGLGTNAIWLLSDGVGATHTSTAALPDSGEVTIHAPADASSQTMTQAKWNIAVRGAGASGKTVFQDGTYTVAEAHDAIKLLTDTNSFASGCAALYKYTCTP